MLMNHMLACNSAGFNVDWTIEVGQLSILSIDHNHKIISAPRFIEFLGLQIEIILIFGLPPCNSQWVLSIPSKFHKFHIIQSHKMIPTVENINTKSTSLTPISNGTDVFTYLTFNGLMPIPKGVSLDAIQTTCLCSRNQVRPHLTKSHTHMLNNQ